MASLTVWTDFSKRIKSTKQPTGGAVVDVKLKENTSIENPVFIVSGLANANYCKYLDNYYFVDDIIFVTNTIVELHCSMDSLATNKNNIIGAQAFVKYYTHTNNDIIDTRLSTKTEPVISSASQTFNHLGEGTCYMLSAVGTDGVKVYACDKNTVDNILPSNVLQAILRSWEDDFGTLENIHVGDVTDIPQALKTIIMAWSRMNYDVNHSLSGWDKCQDSIRSCFLLPLLPETVGSNEEMIKLGRVETGKNGLTSISRTILDSVTVNIPWQATDWRRNAPYHAVYLYIPYLGLVNIPISEIIGSNTITVNVSIDTYSGSAIFKISASNGTTISQHVTSLASQYSIGSSNIDIIGSAQNVITNGLSLGVGIATENPALIGGGALGLVNPINTFNTCIGANTGVAGLGLGNNVTCITVFHDTTVEPSSVSAIQGTPFNGVMAIPSSGYVQTVGADITSVAYGSEKGKINSMLDNGIYIE